MSATPSDVVKGKRRAEAPEASPTPSKKAKRHSLDGDIVPWPCTKATWFDLDTLDMTSALNVRLEDFDSVGRHPLQLVGRTTMTPEIHAEKGEVGSDLPIVFMATNESQRDLEVSRTGTNRKVPETFMFVSFPGYLAKWRNTSVPNNEPMGSNSGTSPLLSDFRIFSTISCTSVRTIVRLVTPSTSRTQRSPE